MDARRIHDEHLIERYLAHQMSAAEAEAFEAHYANNPDAVRDIERTLRLKEGLAVLSEHGALESLIRARPGWAVPAALAAALAVVMVGTWWWTARHDPTPVVATLAQMSGSSGQPVQVASTLVLARMRGPTSTIETPLPPERGAIELRMLASTRTDHYRVNVALMQLANGPLPIGSAHGLRASDEGFVTAWLDTEHLRPGRYAIELVPERSASPGAPSDRFVISLR